MVTVDPPLLAEGFLAQPTGPKFLDQPLSVLSATPLDSPSIEQSKGRKDRYTLLPKSTLKILRDYYRAERSIRWLFNGRNRGEQITACLLQGTAPGTFAPDR